MSAYQFLPSLNLDEYEALRESIRKYGVIQPVIVDENGAIIDGYHRGKVCKELGIDYPTRVLEGLSEEEKENLSVSLNIKRRHMTKDQKKEFALALREQGWTQERIAGVMEVNQATIARWLQNMQMHKPDQYSPRENEGGYNRYNLDAGGRPIRQMPNPDQSSPIIPKADETEKLKKQLEYYAAKVRELENAPKPEPAKIEPEIIEKLVSERVTVEAAALEKARREADAERVNFEREHEKKLAALKESDEHREKMFNERLGRKLKEIDEAAKAGLDLGKLNRELEDLRIESNRLKREIDEERESLNVRAKMKKILSAVIPAITLSSLVNKTVSDSPNYCGLSVEDMETYVSEIDSVIIYSQVTKKAFLEFIEKLRQGGGLRVVQND